jgi:hypothetical protein
MNGLVVYFGGLFWVPIAQSKSMGTIRVPGLSCLGLLCYLLVVLEFANAAGILRSNPIWEQKA